MFCVFTQQEWKLATQIKFLVLEKHKVLIPSTREGKAILLAERKRFSFDYLDDVDKKGVIVSGRIASEVLTGDGGH